MAFRGDLGRSRVFGSRDAVAVVLRSSPTDAQERHALGPFDAVEIPLLQRPVEGVSSPYLATLEAFLVGPFPICEIGVRAGDRAPRIADESAGQIALEFVRGLSVGLRRLLDDA